MMPLCGLPSDCIDFPRLHAERLRSLQEVPMTAVRWECTAFNFGGTEARSDQKEVETIVQMTMTF